MSSGAQDIFSIMSNSFCPAFEKECHNLGLLKMDGSGGETLNVTLKNSINKHGVTRKDMAYVFDGGSSLAKCSDILKSTVTCSDIFIDFPYAGNCWAHILSTSIAKAGSVCVFFKLSKLDNVYNFIALLLYPRYTRLIILLDYAKIDGGENIPQIKQTVKSYLNVLIEWLQSLYNSMHCHDVSVHNRAQEIADVFDLFDVTSPEVANVESVVRNEFSVYQRD